MSALIKVHHIEQRVGEVGRSVAEYTRAGLRPLIPVEAAVLVRVSLRKEGLRICRDLPAQQPEILCVYGELTDKRFIKRIVM